MSTRERDGAEIEWQLELQDLRPVLRWLEDERGNGTAGVSLRHAATVTHVDTYLDTADRRLDRAGYTVRIRRAPRLPTELTLKSLATVGQDALRVRRELSQELSVDPGTTLPAIDGPVTARVRALAGSRKLVALFDVRTHRRTFALGAGNGVTGQLALDDTVIHEAETGKVLGRLRRVEVEAPEESVRAVRPLVENLQHALGLQPAVLSKYEAALAASGHRRAESESFGPTSFGEDATAGQVALAILRRHFAVLLAKEPGARLGDEIEDLHEMRVATRRLRSAVALFEDVLPAEAGRQRPELAWLAQTVGDVRDLDVEIDGLNRWIDVAPSGDLAGLARFRTLLETQRADARASLLQALDSPRYDRFVRRFGSMLRSRSGTRTGAARTAVPTLVLQRQRQVEKWLKRVQQEHEPEAYHRLRIAAKRFRYSLEFLAGVYPRETAAVVKRAVALQDVLGAYQDGRVATQRLRELAVSGADELGAEAVFAMGGLAEHYRAQMEASLFQVEPLARRLQRKAWKQLRKRLIAASDERSSASDDVAPL
ncbi:MAG: CHAD domain-containing protein [Gaiellaceae bacterium]